MRLFNVHDIHNSFEEAETGTFKCQKLAEKVRNMAVGRDANVPQGGLPLSLGQVLGSYDICYDHKTRPVSIGYAL